MGPDRVVRHETNCGQMAGFDGPREPGVCVQSVSISISSMILSSIVVTVKSNYY